MEVFKDLKGILEVESIDIDGCILADKNTTINVVAQQIWEGSNSILSRMPKVVREWFGFDGVDGIIDILDEYTEKKEIKTVIFYIPKSTLKEIRAKLTKREKANTKIIEESIENYIFDKCNNIDDLIVYNLKDENKNIKNIFNTERLRKEFDQNSRVAGQIYILGLRQSLVSDNVELYVNNTPIQEGGGLILGKSPILKHQLNRGFVNLFLDEYIEIEFYKTNKFTSTNSYINEDLEDIDDGDFVTIDLENQDSPFILKAQRDNDLIFSTEKVEDIIDDPIAPNLLFTEVSMESFFIPKDKNLTSVNLLLINKNGQRILAGGQYHSGLTDCDIIAEVIVDLEQELFIVTNRSKESLSFANYDNEVWRLEEGNGSHKKSQNAGYNAGIYTEILTSSTTTSLDDDIITQIGNLSSEEDEIIKEGETHIFKFTQIDFNDSVVSFDSSGVSIHYKSFLIKKFKNELALHRETSTMSATGTIIDCFVEQKPLSRGEYLHGARVYSDDSSKILGTFISSKPITLLYKSQGLEIDASLLIARDRYFKVQISASSSRYILENRKVKQIVKKQDINDLLIEVIHEKITKPIISFTVDIV